jgi:predicted neuraminidase
MRAIIMLLLAAALVIAAPPFYQSELIFPLEKWHNHSSSIVELPDGDLLVCWFHGSGERTADDVVINAARFDKQTGKWTAPFILADTPGFPDTNPTMFIDSKQRLFLLWPTIIAHQWETALMKYRISSDYQQKSGPPKWEHQDNIILIPKNIGEKTREVFGKYVNVEGAVGDKAKKVIEHADDMYFSRMGWFTRTHPLQLPSGRILVPMYSDGYSFGIMAISDDGGYTWNASEPIVGFGGVQPSVVRKKDGSLVAYLRDNGPAPKRAQISHSPDEGISWTPATDTDILNPGTSLEVIALRNGDWIMVYNDLEDKRYSLVAAISDDEGLTWKWRRHLDGNPDVKVTNEYHYPSVIQAKDGKIHVTYSYFMPEGKSIKHAQFDEAWVRSGDPAAGVNAPSK